MASGNERRRLGLREYVLRRNGVPLGAPGGLRNMLTRSFGAPSFAVFWQYWNPVFGYGLARWVDAPLRRIVPVGISVVITFTICGALHDAVTAAVRGGPAFLFTPWFGFLGVGVVLGRITGMNLSGQPFAVKALVNTAYLAACLLPALAIRPEWAR